MTWCGPGEHIGGLEIKQALLFTQDSVWLSGAAPFSRLYLGSAHWAVDGFVWFQIHLPYCTVFLSGWKGSTWAQIFPPGDRGASIPPFVFRFAPCCRAWLRLMHHPDVPDGDYRVLDCYGLCGSCKSDLFVERKDRRLRTTSTKKNLKGECYLFNIF